MTSLGTSDFESALRFVRHCDAARDIDDFASRVLAISELVPCDIVGYNSVDLAAGRVQAVIDPPGAVPDAAYPRFEQFVHQHPVIAHHERTGDWRPCAISDFLTEPRFHRLDLYREFYGPLGIEDQLSMLLPPSSRVIGIALNRARRGFSDRDRTLLDILRPHIAAAHRTAQARASARRLLSALGDALDEAGRSLVVVAADGRLTWSTARAPDLLAGYFGAPAAASALPDEVARWLAARRRADREGTLGSPTDGLVAHRGSSRLLLQHVPARDGEADMVLLLQGADPLAGERLHALGLTPRQAEVASRLVYGRSNAEIATDLGLSVRTVEKHLEGIYRSLGVRGRTEALSRLLAPSAHPGESGASGLRDST